MIKKPEYFTALGMVAMLIDRRKGLDDLEGIAAEVLKGMGGKDGGDQPYSMKIKDYVGEAVYNSGDDPEQAAEQLLEALHLKVEDA